MHSGPKGACKEKKMVRKKTGGKKHTHQKKKIKGRKKEKNRSFLLLFDIELGLTTMISLGLVCWNKQPAIQHNHFWSARPGIFRAMWRVRSTAFCFDISLGSVVYVRVRACVHACVCVIGLPEHCTHLLSIQHAWQETCKTVRKTCKQTSTKCERLLTQARTWIGTPPPHAFIPALSHCRSDRLGWNIHRGVYSILNYAWLTL